MGLIQRDLRPLWMITSTSRSTEFPTHHPRQAMPAFVAPFLAKKLRVGRDLAIIPTKMSAEAVARPKVTLYTMPISNYGARVRYLIRRKKLTEDQVQISLPKDLGGIKSEDYLKMNPLGKMPAAYIEEPKGSSFLYESSVICEYLAEVFSDQDPCFIPKTPEARAKARLIANLLDVYVGPHHMYMYKKTDADRAEGVKKMDQGFDAIEHALSLDGPYAVGDQLSIADCCLWGNWPFYDFMLPTFFARHPTDGRPKLAAWYKHMQNESSAAREVYADVFNALYSWWDKGRWNDLGMTAVTPRPEISF